MMARNRVILCFCVACYLVTLSMGMWITGEGLLIASMQALAVLPFVAIFAAVAGVCVILLISVFLSLVSSVGMLLLLLVGPSGAATKWGKWIEAKERRLGHWIADQLSLRKTTEHDAK
ncbi:hypothetical protein KUV51_20660 [Tateyamaria omphalii]|uniref:hypothetical protein n=1 Tax=Tateyamaria omphalii TaxID=299262 RepID=UPI001C99A6AB|nr:hypothetical protein [Tateyamaria omphalii]MBY5935431.1 hypothetical protein [Tateyamaria omphalii]